MFLAGLPMGLIEYCGTLICILAFDTNIIK